MVGCVHEGIRVQEENRNAGLNWIQLEKMIHQLKAQLGMMT